MAKFAETAFDRMSLSFESSENRPLFGMSLVLSRIHFRRIAMSLSMIALMFSHENAEAFSLKGTVFDQVGQEANIDPVLLYSIALCESGFNPSSTKMVAPYPWVLRTPNKPIYAQTEKEARARLSTILKKSNAVDVGLMQINVRWHGHRIKNAEDLLDPLTNVRIGADILNENFARHPHDAIQAIGNYHSFQSDRARSYGLTVWRVFSTLKAWHD